MKFSLVNIPHTQNSHENKMPNSSITRVYHSINIHINYLDKLAPLCFALGWDARYISLDFDWVT